ncbi:unnamed protein product [Ectocarpus sp. 12 AP-2014]
MNVLPLFRFESKPFVLTSRTLAIIVTANCRNNMLRFCCQALGGLFVNSFLQLTYLPFPHIFARFFGRIGILQSCDGGLRSAPCFVAEGFAGWIVGACIGPLPLAILLCWYPWRCLWQRVCYYYIEPPDFVAVATLLHAIVRQAEMQKIQRAVDRLQKFQDHRMWHAGGWLIMMRARRQNTFARPKAWPVRLRKNERDNEATIIKLALRDSIGDLAPPEIELVEAGSSEMNFVRAVIAVVELNEEGLFRHIITYL